MLRRRDGAVLGMLWCALALSACDLFQTVREDPCPPGQLGCVCAQAARCDEGVCASGMCMAGTTADLGADMSVEDMPAQDMGQDLGADMPAEDMGAEDMPAQDMGEVDMGGTPPLEIRGLALGGAFTCVRRLKAGAAPCDDAEGPLCERPRETWCWGDGTNAPFGRQGLDRWKPAVTELPDAARITAGTAHTCLIPAAGGQAQCQGGNDRGQLGVGDAPPQVDIPTTLYTVTTKHNTTCGIDLNDRAWCWGEGFHGQIGSGTTAERFEPVLVSTSVKMSAVYPNRDHTCALSFGAAEVYCWGENNKAQLGLDPESAPPGTLKQAFPYKVPGLSDVLELAVAKTTTCALKDDHSVWCWGSNRDSQISRFDFVNGYTHEPVLIESLPAMNTITAGDDFFCGITQDATGDVWCWGDNSSGQLGYGSLEVSTSPVKVKNVTFATEVAAGHEHACAFSLDGLLWCWGRNQSGQLGTQDFTETATPVPIIFR